MAATLHPSAPAHLPGFVTPPGETDGWLVFAAVFLIVGVIGGGALILRLHSLPERMAHRSQKFQFEVVAVLGLLALVSHVHAFWVAALLLAIVDLPDISNPVGRMARALETIAGLPVEPPPATERQPESGETGRAGHGA